MFSILLDTNNLHIVNTQSEQCVAKVCLPPFRKSVRGSNFTPGNTSWLEGFHTVIQDRLLFAISMPDHSILVLRLKDVTGQSRPRVKNAAKNATWFLWMRHVTPGACAQCRNPKEVEGTLFQECGDRLRDGSRFYFSVQAKETKNGPISKSITRRSIIDFEFAKNPRE